ncbi:MAG: phytanoyl-CoA dioxygenase [Sphingomonadales bacterium BRH_c3]|nr:MAG: phytanoyl-CoA dioxygenase [Sphingomonadales bacterium BRH_c3]
MTKGHNASQWAQRLLRDGYCIIPGLLPVSDIAELESELDGQFEQTPFCDGDFYGYRTKRLGRLLRRSQIAEKLVLEPVILALAKEILGSACDQIQLNVAQAIEIHPGEIEQFPHCDQDMWAGVKGQHEYLLNVMWPITPFTDRNGATRIYPGTHKLEIQSIEELGSPVIAESDPGSAICFLGSTVHGAGANRSQAVRRAVVIGYSLGWLKPYENLWLAYPPEIAKTFAPELAALTGYVQHRPNLGNYEGQCPSVVLRDDVPCSPGATDALRPDQAAAVREFARSQRAAG